MTSEPLHCLSWNRPFSGSETIGKHCTHDIPLRKTVYGHRVSGEVVDVGEPQEWLKLSKLKRVGNCGPARISLTMFGRAPESLETGISEKGVVQADGLDHSLEQASEGWAPRPIAVSGLRTCIFEAQFGRARGSETASSQLGTSWT